jgi:hypothetical protein
MQLREEREEFLATDCTDGHKGKEKEIKIREDLREDTDKKK